MIGGSGFWQKQVGEMLVAITELEVVGAWVVTVGPYDVGGACETRIVPMDEPESSWMEWMSPNHAKAISAHEMAVGDLMLRGTLWKEVGSGG